MSFDNKYYPNRKDWRKSTLRPRCCRSNGSCKYCSEGRQHKHEKRELSATEQIKYELNNEWLSDYDKLEIVEDCGIWQSLEYTIPQIIKYSSNDYEHESKFSDEEWKDMEKYITKKV